LLQVALCVDDWTGPTVTAKKVSATSAPLGLGLLGVRVDQLQQSDLQIRAGMSGYLLIFEILSVHLLVVLIGAAYLARAKRRPGDRTQPKDSGFGIQDLETEKTSMLNSDPYTLNPEP
jgi:hypothetical protein